MSFENYIQNFKAPDGRILQDIDNIDDQNPFTKFSRDTKTIIGII